MGQTLEQLNAVRRMKGEEPLTELPATDAPAAVPENQPENENKPPVIEQKEEPKPQPTPAAIPELSDAAVLEYLKKNKGLTVASLDDLNKPVENDPEKAAEDRENAKLSYGLNKGLVNRKTHEQFILDRSNKQQLVFAQYYQEAKKEDPELTDEDIQTEFAAKFGLDTEPATRKHKRGLQEIEILGDIILKNKYQNIYKLDGEYEAHEKSTTSQRQFEQKILSEAPNYKKAVDDVFGELKKVTTKISDDESYEVEVLDEAIAGLKEKFLDQNYVAQMISQGYTKEGIKEVAFSALLNQNWPLFAKEMINQALLKHQKGVKGIIPVGNLEKAGDPFANLNDNQKSAINRLFPNQVPVAAN
jgi:hypothetical protein